MIFQRWRISSFIAFRFCLLFICLLVSFSLLIFAVRLPKNRKKCVHWTLFSDRQKCRRGGGAAGGTTTTEVVDDNDAGWKWKAKPPKKKKQQRSNTKKEAWPDDTDPTATFGSHWGQWTRRRHDDQLIASTRTEPNRSEFAWGEYQMAN